MDSLSDEMLAGFVASDPIPHQQHGVSDVKSRPGTAEQARSGHPRPESDWDYVSFVITRPSPSGAVALPSFPNTTGVEGTTGVRVRMATG
jgi:hypothetical protein